MPSLRTMLCGIFIGGASRRMGFPKARLRLSTGEALLERTVRVVCEAGLDPVLVGSHVSIEPCVRLPSIRSLPDAAPDSGPLGGLVSGGLFAIVYGLSNAATSATNAQSNGTSVTLASAFGNATTIGALVLGVALVSAFVWRQYRIPKPMLPMSIVTDRARGGSFLSVLLAAAAMFGVFLFLTYYLQTVLGFSPVRAGLAFLPMVVMLTATAMVGSARGR